MFQLISAHVSRANSVNRDVAVYYLNPSNSFVLKIVQPATTVDSLLLGMKIPQI